MPETLTSAKRMFDKNTLYDNNQRLSFQQIVLLFVGLVKRNDYAPSQALSSAEFRCPNNQ